MRLRRPPAFLTVLALLFCLTPLDPAAERLPAGVRPSHYDLAFDVDLTRGLFEGTETIRVQLDRPTTRIVLNALDLTFHDVTIGTRAAHQSAAVAPDTGAQTVTLTVPRAIPAGTADIRIRYAGTLNSQLRGFYLSRAGGRNYAITQFESSDARRAFPCFDEPAMKATFDIRLTIDRGDTAISNGRLLSDTPAPGNSRHTLVFATSPRMSSYLVAMAVGDFQCLEDTAENIPIRVCATPGKKELGRIALDWAKEILTFYNRYFSIKYPFGKLDMIAVPDFAAGAMENIGAIFYREADLLADTNTASPFTRKSIASILAHEMAHQWFGNLVTMRWWDDLWLNEGLATWMANRPLAAAKPEWNIAVDEVGETREALNLDLLQTTRAVHSRVETPEQIEESFDAIAYQKGAAVTRMIEHYLGPEVLRTSINRYLEKYAYGNATSENFWTVMTSVSGKPVDRILPTFVNQPGAPLVEVSLDCRNGRTQLLLRQRRFSLADPTLGSGGTIVGPTFRSGATPVSGASPVGPTFRSGATPGSGDTWQIPVCVKTPGQPTAACQVFGRADASIRVTTVGNGCPPWAFINAGAQGYFRTAYAPDLLRALAPDIGSKLTAAERSSLADDEWALVQSGRHTVGDYLTLASGFGSEQSAGVLGQITSRLEFIDSNVVTDATRPGFAAWVRTLLRPLFAELGVAARDDAADPEDRRALRAVVIGALGTFGDDPDVVSGARSLLDRALSTPATFGLDGTVANAVVRVAARHGDLALYHALVAAAESSTAPDQHYLYLYGLPAFEDPNVSQRALDYALSNNLRRQDTAEYLARFLRNPAVSARAWHFLKEHWSDLQPKLTVSFGDVRVVEALGSFCTPVERDDVQAFFAEHRLGAVARTVHQSIERMNNCITLRDKQAPILAKWLADRR